MKILDLYPLSWLPLGFMLLCSAGCETVGFYHQAAMGQWQLLRDRVPVAALLEDPATDPELVKQLTTAQGVLDFATEHLGLEQQGRYESYVALQRDYVVWNVFAAPVDSVQGHTWCYPIAGCAPYRGYFKKAAAEAYAVELHREGLETYVGGVPAYSTLGWFEDPLLSSFIHWPSPQLANLLIHELTHGRIWRDDDVVFNESLASFVGEKGTELWFAQQGRGADYATWQNRNGEWRRARSLLLELKSQLHEVFTGGLSESAKEQAKKRLYSAFDACLNDGIKQPSDRASDTPDFRHRILARLNNAYLASLGTYADLVPAFAELYRQQKTWTAFFAAVDELAALPSVELAQVMAALTEQHVGDGADNDAAEQVHCQPFLSHSAHTESAR